MKNNQLSFWAKIKYKISNILTPKPKTFLLGTGEPLEINGKFSDNTVYRLGRKLGSKLVNSTLAIKSKFEKSKIKNTPFVHSTSLTPREKIKKTPLEQNVGLLGQGQENIRGTIIPEQVQTIASSTPAPPILTANHPRPKTSTTIQLSTETITGAINKYTNRTQNAIKTFRRSYLANTRTCNTFTTNRTWTNTTT